MSNYAVRCGDAIDLLKRFPMGAIDAVICDPPYGTTRNPWDAVIPIDDMWRELRRIVKPRGAMVFTSMQPFTSALVMSNVECFRHEWVWHKNKATGHLNAKKAPMRAHENVLVFCDAQPTFNPQMTSGHAPVNKHYTRHNGSNYGAGVPSSGGGSTCRYPRTVQEFAVINNDNPLKAHATQKPIPLMEYLVRTYSNIDDVVLDFAMGSGTTGIACLLAGRRFIGIDIDAEMVAIANSRLAQQEKELQL